MEHPDLMTKDTATLDPKGHLQIKATLPRLEVIEGLPNI